MPARRHRRGQGGGRRAIGGANLQLPRVGVAWLAQRQLQGGFGGMVSFELARSERAAAEQVLNRLALFTQAVSLGDVDSLACHPASTTHSFVSAEARAANGVTEGLIRLSVGIEHPEDLIGDLNRALAL